MAKTVTSKIENHHCEIDTPSGAYGSAIDFCWEKEDGKLWVSNMEYSNQVNYCPNCGYKAKTKVEMPTIKVLPDGRKTY